jgi:amino acid adenylation domain-containing protein
VEFNRTSSEYPNEPAHLLFERYAENSPDAIAVIHEDASISYSELNRRANRLAHHLQSMGVGPEALVAISLDNSLDMLITIVATLKAGGAYMPLDLAYPADRLAFMLDDSQAAVLVCNSATAQALPAHSRTLNIETDAALLAAQPDTNLPSEVGLENTAYVMYTSGSTGKPKGSVIRHRGIVRLVSNTNYVRLHAADRIAQVSNMSFDAATFEIWGALTSGGCVVMIGRDVSLTPSLLAASLRKHAVTTMFLTTALFNQIAAEVPDAFNGLTSLLVGGQVMDPKWVRAVLEKGGPQRMMNVYGPTESTTYSTWHLIDEAGAAAASVPIGKAIANTQTYVLDANLEPVPTGILGELYIGGDGLARNYLRRPDLTAERFIPNPFATSPGDRLYKTGDLARLLPDGAIDFCGRADGQIKIRGFRVELPEIEVAMYTHPLVREAYAVVYEPNPGDMRIAAYAAVDSPDTADANELREFLEQRLPEFMVPSAFVFVETLPLNANGKVDREALPAPGVDRAQFGSTFRAPRSASEELLAGWEWNASVSTTTSLSWVVTRFWPLSWCRASARPSRSICRCAPCLNRRRSPL